MITDNTKLLYYPPSLDHTSIPNVIISVGKSNYICISYEHVKTMPPQLNIVKRESAALGEADDNELIPLVTAVGKGQLWNLLTTVCSTPHTPVSGPS